MHFLAVAQHDHHRRATLHLFLIIEILGIGLLWRSDFLAAAPRWTLATIAAFCAFMPFRAFPPFLRHRYRAMIAMILAARQSRPDQFSIREMFLFGRLGRGHRMIHDFLHKRRKPRMHAFA